MLKFKEITERPVKEKEQPFAIRRTRPYTPPPDHTLGGEVSSLVFTNMSEANS
jgi:hypothetical protein